jgi:hypothetical protein
LLWFDTPESTYKICGKIRNAICLCRIDTRRLMVIL